MREAAIQFQIDSPNRMAEKVATLSQDSESLQDDVVKKVNKRMWEQM